MFNIGEGGDYHAALSLLDLISAEMTLNVKRPFAATPRQCEKLLLYLCTKKVDGRRWTIATACFLDLTE
jgi:hypothetical protein